MTAARTPLVAGNWKLQKTRAEARALIAGLLAAEVPAGVEVAVAPVFTALSTVGQALSGSPIVLCAQDVYWEPKGAFTGEVSAPLLADVGCSLVIVGHSERRQLFGETDEAVAKKARAVLAEGMTPIICVGETLAQRRAGRAEETVVTQVSAALGGLQAEQVRRTVLAYEPIWAIGTGETAEPADAQQMHAAIRARLSAMFGQDVAQSVRIQYGGSVKPANAAALMSQPDVDGALVGGASLEADSFLAIITAAAR